MKRLLILLILTFLFAGNIFSQDSSKSNEIGIYFTSTSRFGLRFKLGSENIMFRITALALYLTDEETETEEYTREYNRTGFGLNFGLETPISITKDFNFFYGGEFMLEYSYRATHTDTYHDKDKNYEAGLGIILGFAYKINQDFIVSAEIVPKYYYSYDESSNQNSKTYGFRLTNDYAGITVGYRF